jgi:hypothetical protein
MPSERECKNLLLVEYVPGGGRKYLYWFRESSVRAFAV